MLRTASGNPHDGHRHARRASGSISRHYPPNQVICPIYVSFADPGSLAAPGIREKPPVQPSQPRSRPCGYRRQPVQQCSILPPRGQDAPRSTPAALEAALAAKPQGADAERLAERIRDLLRGRGAVEGVGGAEDRRADRSPGRWSCRRPPPTRRRPRVVSDAVHFTMPLTRVGTRRALCRRGDALARRGVHVALRERPTAGSAAASSRSTRRTPTAASSRACRRARSSRCRRGRARSSRARGATGGSTCRRSTGPRRPAAVMVFQDGSRLPRVRADGLRQPDRQGRHAGHGRHLHPAGRVRGRPRRTAASNTTRCRTSTRASCSRRSCRRWRRP